MIAAGIVIIAGIILTCIMWQPGTEKDESEKGGKAVEDQQAAEEQKESEDRNAAPETGEEENLQGENGNGKSSVYPGSENGTTIPFKDDSRGLEVTMLDNYSGYYIEDGSEEKVENVAVITVKNTSDEAIEYGTLRLSQGEKELKFQFSLIPSGAEAIVMEAERQPYDQEAAVSYEGSTVANLEAMDKAEDKVSVETVGDGGISVTNVSKQDISELRIFYKNRLDESTYMGGIAYNSKIENLNSGESKVIYPSHFSAEYGEIMMVRVYGETD